MNATLPCPSPRAAGPSLASVPAGRRLRPQPAGRKRILLADDLLSIRDSLGHLLRQQGYHVAVAENGREAVERACLERFDLVLLDLSMPEMNGWEALKQITAARPTLPVIVITALPHQRGWIERDGAWGLLEKPFNIPLLLDTISEMISSSAQSDCPSSSSVRPRFRHWPAEQQFLFNREPRACGINE